MKVSVDGVCSSAEQMSRDWELYERALKGEFSARLYEWDHTWLTIGRFQVLEDTLLDPQQQNWTRRQTGGAAVLHGHDLTIAVAMPLTQLGRVKEVYRMMVTPIVHAFLNMGIKAALGADAGAFGISSGASCFETKSENDVVSLVTGAKLCGCALRVTREAALLQASIPVRKPEVLGIELIYGAGNDEWLEVEFNQLVDNVLKELRSQ